VSIGENDWKEFKSHGVFSGLEFQKHVERNAFNAGGRIQTALSQRITDFIFEKQI